MTPERLLASLVELQFKNTFNPYSTRCALHDRDDAPCRRSETLSLILEAASRVEVDSIWIGRDLGYRGGRRTGLALTDDFHISAHAGRWGIAAQRATKGEAVAERTAAVIWRMLAQISAPIFLWNVFPLHPHEPGDPFTNRRHNVDEREAGESFLVELIRLLRPRRLVALRNDGTQTVRRLLNTQELVSVRHPSYGGQTMFEAQMRDLYGLRGLSQQAEPLR